MFSFSKFGSPHTCGNVRASRTCCSDEYVWPFTSPHPLDGWGSMEGQHKKRASILYITCTADRCGGSLFSQERGSALHVQCITCDTNYPTRLPYSHCLNLCQSPSCLTKRLSNVFKFFTIAVEGRHTVAYCAHAVHVTQ